MTKHQKSDTISSVQTSHQFQTETDLDDKESSESAAGASGQISSEDQGIITQPETSVSMHVCDDYSDSFNDYNYSRE